MMCVGHFDIKPFVYEKYIKKKKVWDVGTTKLDMITILI